MGQGGLDLAGQQPVAGLRDRLEEVDEVEPLVGEAAHLGRFKVAGDSDERQPIQVGHRDGAHHVHGPRAAGDDAEPRHSCEKTGGARHVAGGGFVVAQDEGDVHLPQTLHQ